MGNKRVKILTRLVALLSIGGAAPTFANPESCTQIESSDERLACYDSYFMTSATNADRSVGENVPAEPAVGSNQDLIEVAQVEQPSVESNEVVAVEGAEVVASATGSDAPISAEVVAEAESKAREAYEQVITDAQSLTISAVQRTRRGSVFFQTEQGRTFKRETSRNVYFSEGDTVIIERGVFSSLFLENQDGLRIKVSEVD